MLARAFVPVIVGDLVTTPTNRSAKVTEVRGADRYDLVIVEEGIARDRGTWRQGQLVNHTKLGLKPAPVVAPAAPAPAPDVVAAMVQHNWSRGEVCSCGQETVICQGCGRQVCGDVATWVERPRDGDPGIARTGASSGGRYRSSIGNVGPCCSAKFGLGHGGTPATVEAR
jgi:hypothetical protein